MASCDLLYGEIGRLVVEFVIPSNVLPVFLHKEFLTKEDIQAVEAKTDVEGPSAGARLLLDILVEKENWFEKLHTVLCHNDVKLGHIANIMMHEQDRIQQQSASCQRSCRDTRADSMSTLSDLYIEYNRKLEKTIRELFVRKIDDPVTTLHVFLKCSDKVFTKFDCDIVKTKMHDKGIYQAAYLLFSRLVLYDSWLEVLLQVLNSEDIRLQELAEEIESSARDIKEKYESKRSQIQQLGDNRMATDDPEMKPAVKGQARGHTNKENTFCGRGGQNLAPQEDLSENGHVTTDKMLSTAESGNLDLILDLLGGVTSVDESTLMHASMLGASEYADLLICSTYDVNKADNNGQTALMKAVMDGHTECAQLLINGDANIDLADKYGYTAVLLAAWHGHSECVDLLIRSRCDVNKADIGRCTALMKAVTVGHTKCAKLLINGGANVDLADKYGYTAVMLAAWYGHSECVGLLIRSRCDVNKPNTDGHTALMKAIRAGHSECAQLLINGGANVSLAVSLALFS